MLASSIARTKERGNRHDSTPPTASRLFVTVLWACCCGTVLQLYFGVVFFPSSTQWRNAELDNQPPKLRNHLSAATTTQKATTTPTTAHVLYGLHGNNTGFLDQWEVSLKSVLLNAPLDHPLHIHIVANGQAQVAVLERLEASLLPAYSRNPMDFTIYNVDQCQAAWTQFLQRHFRNKASNVNKTGRFTLGVYYRLLAYQVILPYWEQQQQKHHRPTSGSMIQRFNTSLYHKRTDFNGNAAVNAILYMDADVVVLSNLNDLWRNVIHDENPTGHYNANAQKQQQQPPIYQWSGTKTPNSGFVVFYLKQMHRFWQLLDQLTDLQFKHTGDQAMLTSVAKVFPFVQGRPLPNQWDVHMGHGWRAQPYLLYNTQEKVGMAHFSGKAPGTGKTFLDKVGVMKYCQRSLTCKDNATHVQMYMQTWGLVDYYIRIPWHYVRYFLQSQIPISSSSHNGDDTTKSTIGGGGGGYPISLNVVHWSLPVLDEISK